MLISSLKRLNIALRLITMQNRTTGSDRDAIGWSLKLELVLIRTVA
jgi:hypothetical protein